MTGDINKRSQHVQNVYVQAPLLCQAFWSTPSQISGYPNPEEIQFNHCIQAESGAYSQAKFRKR